MAKTSIPSTPPPTPVTGSARAAEAGSAATALRRKYLLGLMAVLLTGLAGTVWLLLRTPAQPAGTGAEAPPPPGWLLPAQTREPAAIKALAVAPAFTRPEPSPDPAQLQELSHFFTALGRVPLSEDSPAGAHFDFERLYRETLRWGILTPPQVELATAIRSDLIAKLATDGPRHLTALAGVDRFDHATIVRVDGLPATAAGLQGEALVYLQRFDPGGGFAKERWWLVKSPAGWQAYDFENLYTGVRYSQYLAMLLQDAQENRRSPVADLLLLRAWLERGSATGPEAAAELQQLPVAAEAAPEIRALAHYCRALAALAAADLPLAQREAEAALALQPDFPVARYLIGECHNREAQYEAALQDAAAIDRQLGRDPLAAELRATALLGLDRSAELAAEFAVVLDHQPTDAAAVESLFRWLPAERRSEACARYAALVAAGDGGTALAADRLFHRLGEQAIAAHDPAALEALIQARLDGRNGSLTGVVAGGGGAGSGGVVEAGDDLAVLYRVQVLQLREQWQLLRDYVARALPQVRDDQLRQLIREIGWRAAARDGQALAAYQTTAAAEKMAAFRALAEALRAAEKVDGLAALILAHHAEHPEDPWIHFYAGTRSLLQADYARAEAHFAEAVAKAPEGGPQALFRSYWLSAAYNADHGIQAYDSCSDKKMAFAQLKRYYLEDGRDELLEMLVERYRPLGAADPELLLAVADVQFLSGQYDAAIAQLDSGRATILQGTPEQVFEFYDCLLRCLVRQRQFPLAEKELQGVRDPKQEAFLSALVAAAEGKIDGTAVALRQCVKEGFTPAMIYGDVDLGRVLLTTEMQASLSREFPPPAGMGVPTKPEAAPTPGDNHTNE